MTITEYKSIKANYDKILNDLEKKINSFTKYSDGRTTDEARKKPEYIQLKKTFDFAYKQFQSFNSLKESKEYSKKISMDRRKALTK